MKVKTGLFLLLSSFLVFSFQGRPAEASSWERFTQPEPNDFHNFLAAVQGSGPPATIRVRITGSGACSVSAPYTVETIDFNTYVKNVLPNEWAHWWPDDSLKAGAVAVKMYAWYWIARGGKWSDADVIDSACDQRFRRGSATARTDRAVDETWGFVLSKGGSLFETRHNNAPSCQPPHCMRQSGTADLARQGFGWQEVLEHFYPGSDQGTGTGSFGVITPVELATPDASGKVFHVVEPGQSLWAISDAYKITIGEIETWNNISREAKLPVGKLLFIPDENTEGYATPTPEGMIVASTPAPDGKIIHTVQRRETLSRISQAYDVPIARILELNKIRREWPLRLGQELLIDPGWITPSPTQRPLTPIEKLTPESDGKYYHTVKQGQNPSLIANLYEISLFDLLEWNNLSMESGLQPEQKLVLYVTPPATDTPTPSPVNKTPTAAFTPTGTANPTAAVLPFSKASPTPIPGQAVTKTPTASQAVVLSGAAGSSSLEWLVIVLAAAGGISLAVLLIRKRS
jgi:LysM repeat protein